MVMAYIWTGMVLTAVLFSFWSGAGGVLSQAVLEGAQAGVTPVAYTHLDVYKRQEWA